jgi:hypothetical protein
MTFEQQLQIIRNMRNKKKRQKEKKKEIEKKEKKKEKIHLTFSAKKTAVGETSHISRTSHGAAFSGSCLLSQLLER